MNFKIGVTNNGARTVYYFLLLGIISSVKFYGKEKKTFVVYKTIKKNSNFW